MRDSELPKPERMELRQAQLRKRARRALNAAGIKVGGDHLVKPIVDAMVAELEALREHHAGMIFELIERGVTMTNPQARDDSNAMEMLAMMMKLSYVDHEGRTQVVFPDTEG